MTSGETVEVLTSHNIKPSQQRIAIMQYLLEHRTHPTVEDVYNGLVGTYPTLSKTTVYNTLRMFAEHQAALMITIDERHVCYDGDTEPHDHFFCRKCMKVYDIKDSLAPSVPNVKLPEGFAADEVQVYYKGLCPECNFTTID